MTKTQIQAVVKNIIAKSLLIGGDFDYVDFTDEERIYARKCVDTIAYRLIRNCHKVGVEKNDVESIIEDVKNNVK